MQNPFSPEKEIWGLMECIIKKQCFHTLQSVCQILHRLECVNALLLLFLLSYPRNINEICIISLAFSVKQMYFLIQRKSQTDRRVPFHFTVTSHIDI